MPQIFKIKNSLAAILLFALIACERKIEQFETPQIAEYFPTTIGKHIIYRVDSTVFTNFGRTEETHKYQVKHEVDAEIRDNQNRISYRIIRSRRDTAGTQPWIIDGTYFVTSLSDQVEVIENNLRFIKLHLPIKLQTKWKGNRYLSSNPFFPNYSFNNDDNMNDWDYNYFQFHDSLLIGNQQIKDIITVNQIDEAVNVPIVNAGAYASKSFSIEKYAKNIGLVYKDFILWEYQPNPGGTLGYKIGFGMKMWMINHN